MRISEILLIRNGIVLNRLIPNPYSKGEKASHRGTEWLQDGCEAICTKAFRITPSHLTNQGLGSYVNSMPFLPLH